MLYRIKIPYCIDAIVEYERLYEVILYARFLARSICIRRLSSKIKIYIHLLKRENNKLIDLGRIYREVVKEVQHYRS